MLLTYNKVNQYVKVGRLEDFPTTTLNIRCILFIGQLRLNFDFLLIYIYKLPVIVFCRQLSMKSFRIEAIDKLKADNHKECFGNSSNLDLFSPSSHFFFPREASPAIDLVIQSLSSYGSVEL